MYVCVVHTYMYTCIVKTAVFRYVYYINLRYCGSFTISVFSLTLLRTQYS